MKNGGGLIIKGWHNLNRNLNESFALYRKPAIWGFKKFYEKKTWDPSPLWAYDPIIPAQSKKDSR